MRIASGTRKSDDSMVASDMSCHMLGRLCLPGRKSKAPTTRITMLMEKIAPPNLACGLREEGWRRTSTESCVMEIVKSVMSRAVVVTLSKAGLLVELLFEEVA